jgi:hypothetical protein
MTDALMLRPMAALPAAFRTGKVLVVGMGGGCDAVTAYAVAQHLPGLPADAAWGNTKRNPVGLEAVRGHVWRCGAQVGPLAEGENCYGTNKIDMSMPQGPHGSPLVCAAPYIPKNGGTVDAAAVAHLEALAADVVALGFTAVVGVDAGGDSLTGGIDHGGDPSTGTDQLMLRALRATRLPFVHLVPGLGCDGESTPAQLAAAIAAADAEGRFLGTVEMAGGGGAGGGAGGEQWGATFLRYCAMLGPTRTPTLMAAAIAAAAAGGGNGATMKVPRGIEPDVPVAWLARIYAVDQSPPGGAAAL